MLTPRLGLALSGGGFRASLFHLGVLRRLAELDLLRHVGVLSTVSGGSIIAGHYMLRLRARLAQGALREPDDYVGVVTAVEREFRRGVARNLRTRLFWNPLANLRHLATRYPLGRRMARLYHRHLYREAAAEISPEWFGGVPLGRVRLHPDAAEFREALPKWVINATCLNTGRNFRFTTTEVGDPVLGYIRFDEVELVLGSKQLLALAARHPDRALGAVRDGRTALRDRTGWHLVWWLAVRQGIEAERGPDAPGAALAVFRSRAAAAKVRLGSGKPAAVAALLEDWDASRRLANAEVGLLRRAKAAAWRLRNRPDRPDRGIVAEAMWDALEDIDEEAAARLQGRLDRAASESLEDLLVDLYTLRSADAFGWTAGEVLNGLTLADAVAASANFPPVFPPFTVFGLYDSQHVWSLALTDGGVDDNQGLSALLDEGCTQLIVSDAGGLLALEERAATGRLGMMARISESLMSNVRSLQLRQLREQRRVSAGVGEVPVQAGQRLFPELRSRYNLEAVAFFHMTSNPDDAYYPTPDALPPHLEARAIARLRTDLDAFHDTEIDGLLYQGYQLADRFVRQHIAPSFRSGRRSIIAAPVTLPVPGDTEGWESVRRVLRTGRRRVLRALALSPWLQLVVGVLAVVGVVRLLSLEVSLGESGTWIANAVAAAVRRPLLVPVIELPLESRLGVAGLGMALLIAGGLWLAWPGIERRLAQGLAVVVGGVRWKSRAIRAVETIGLWRRFVWFFAALLPIWLAAAASAAAWLVYGLDALGRRLHRVRRPPSRPVG